MPHVVIKGWREEYRETQRGADSRLVSKVGGVAVARGPRGEGVCKGRRKTTDNESSLSDRLNEGLLGCSKTVGLSSESEPSSAQYAQRTESTAPVQGAHCPTYKTNVSVINDSWKEFQSLTDTGYWIGLIPELRTKQVSLANNNKGK